jgi:hypothetical protein
LIAGLEMSIFLEEEVDLRVGVKLVGIRVRFMGVLKPLDLATSDLEILL